MNNGPFGAKSIGELVIDSPSPAIAHAVYNATGVWVRDLPITAEKTLSGHEAEDGLILNILKEQKETPFHEGIMERRSL